MLAATCDWLLLVWKVSPAAGPVLTQRLSPTEEELETHADLARAYAEMGLLPDALQHAAWVLTKAAAASAPSSALGLDVLFGECLANPGAVDELRRRLAPS